MLSALAAVICIAAACEPSTPVTPDNKPAASPSPAVSPGGSPEASPDASPKTDKADDGKADIGPADKLVARWNGPEGTYLNVTKKDGKYSVEIADLDGPKTYEGTAKGDTIEFKRDGKTETIKAATGEETGMKGFEKEKDCVVVTKGKEGFCKK